MRIEVCEVHSSGGGTHAWKSGCTLVKGLYAVRQCVRLVAMYSHKYRYPRLSGGPGCGSRTAARHCVWTILRLEHFATQLAAFNPAVSPPRARPRSRELATLSSCAQSFTKADGHVLRMMLPDPVLLQPGVCREVS